MFDVRSFLGQKLGRDIVWTIASFGVLAMSGMAINFVITGTRDAAALGIFNLTYAIYVIASQVASMGVHYSVLRQTALLEKDPSERGKMLATGVVTSLVLGVLAAVGLELLAPLLSHLFDSPKTILALRYAALGLILFPTTKVLIACVNGVRHMRAFSVFQALRYIVVMGWVSAISISERNFEEAALCFLVAEISTIVVASLYLFIKREFRSLRFSTGWMKEHLRFGSRSLFAGMFSEMNSRIDIILLGIFLSDQQVGIYSFAAMLADGVYHLLAMVRVNFNPLIVAAMRDKSWVELQRLLGVTKRYMPIATGLLAIILLLSLYSISEFFLPSKGLAAGLPSMLILLVGITIISPFVPFDNLLLNSGFPALQTVQQVVVFFANAGLNVLLVPVLGIEGAAIGTAVGYLVGLMVLYKFARMKINWNLFTNTVDENSGAQLRGA
jgi:O-antigen/teichoic acid export membrane protein